MMLLSRIQVVLRPTLTIVLMLGVMSACTPASSVSGINDPHEAANRQTHAFNKALDRALVKPASDVYGAVLPDFALQGIDNFASNLSLPGMVLNDALQLNLPDAFVNTSRFVLNTTVGLGGFFDVASQNGIYVQSTGFGETLHVWGVPEGNFVELPAFGASTERDAVGLIVDFVVDPLNIVVPSPEKYIGTGSKILERFGDRHQYSDLVDSVLYESEDSYAQTRLLYLQSRRRELQGELTEDDLEDPYAE